MATNSSSSNQRLLSDLPLHVFHNLVSRPRALANPIEAATLRQRVLCKLRASNADAGGGVATVRGILRLSPPTLLRVLDPCLTHAECHRLLSRIHRLCAVRPLSALEMMRRVRSVLDDRSPSSVAGKIPTGIPTLDAHLRGGLPVGAVAEVVGRAGVGKTHLAQQLCVLAARSHRGGTVYIDTEKKLSVPRLEEIALERFSDDHNCDALTKELVENVSIHSLFTTRELLGALDGLDDEITALNSQASSENRESTTNGPTRRLPVRLIVVDSIAAPIRRDFDMMGSSSSTAAQRASTIFQIAKKLKQLACDHQVAVVVINHVGSGSMLVGNGLQRNNNLDIRSGEFTASLGTAWQYCVSTRIVLEHEDDPHQLRRQYPGSDNSLRTVTLAKSLISKRTRLPFELKRMGLCEVATS